MKKTLVGLLICVMLFGSCIGCDSSAKKKGNDYSSIYNYGDDYFRSIGDRVTLDLDSPDYLYNDFADGIDSRFSLVTGIWGNDGYLKHQGLQADNIYLTTDGNLAIRINGDYYRGENVGTTNGIRTGAALVTDHDMGPGRFEVRMKAAPPSGVCSAFWTYQYDSADPTVNGWNEIDIEILGGGANGGFDGVMYTTWQSAGKPNTSIPKFDNVTDCAGIRLNDNQWHTHTFDWYTDYMGTGKGRIDWFIDGKLVYHTESTVAIKSGTLWLGAWRPSEFAGDSKFDTAWMLADWVRYTPFLGMDGWIESDYKSEFNSYIKDYPTERITLTDEMLNQRLANTSFENVDTESTVPKVPFVEDYESHVAVGWLKRKILEDESNGVIVADAHSGTNAVKITQGAVEQEIEGAFEGFKYDFEFWAKKADGQNGKLLLRYYGSDGSIVLEETVEITSDDYQEYQKQIVAPQGCNKIRISLRNGIFDDMKCTYTGRN